MFTIVNSFNGDATGKIFESEVAAKKALRETAYKTWKGGIHAGFTESN